LINILSACEIAFNLFDNTNLSFALTSLILIVDALVDGDEGVILMLIWVIAFTFSAGIRLIQLTNNLVVEMLKTYHANIDVMGVVRESH
jgi:hypothetical protein